MLSRITALLVFPALLLSACTSTPGPKGDTGATGPAGTPGVPGPGLTGTVFSDWLTVTPINGAQFSSDKICGIFGTLNTIKELLEARYQNGIALVYARSSLMSVSRQYLLPGQLDIDVSISQVRLNADYITLTMELKSKSYLTINDCPKAAQVASYFSDYKFRYVLIPVPATSAAATLNTSSLHSDLEKARTWYGLNDLSYASVARRFGLHD